MELFIVNRAKIRILCFTILDMTVQVLMPIISKINPQYLSIQSHTFSLLSSKRSNERSYDLCYQKEDTSYLMYYTFLSTEHIMYRCFKIIFHDKMSFICNFFSKSNSSRKYSNTLRTYKINPNKIINLTEISSVERVLFESFKA